MPMILGGVGALVLIVVLVLMNSKRGGGDDNSGDPAGQQDQPAATKREPAPVRTDLKLASAQQGKTPDRPAPELTMEMLGKARDMLNKAKELNREGVRLRTAGENMKARDVQSQAKVVIDQIKAYLDTPATWQEEADMGEWSMPAEYVTLGKLYGEISRVEKMVRMGGGTR